MKTPRSCLARRAISFAAILILAPSCYQDLTPDAEKFARETLGFSDPIVSCQNYDTDGDGYVSCTVSDRASKDREAVECSTWKNFNSGCRLATGKRRQAK